MISLAAYALLFVAVGIGFIFVHLVAGKLIRPSKPAAEKGTIYECGEPTIGSAWIQFDLRFYVVALLFVIFDVEVAFLFPWAEVFGKANAIATATRPSDPASYRDYADKVLDLTAPAVDERTRAQRAHYEQMRELTAENVSSEGPNLLPDRYYRENQEAAHNLAWLALGELLVFFGVLLVGFAYLWRRGDLAWVRSVTEVKDAIPPPPSTPVSVAPAPRPDLAGVGHH